MAAELKVGIGADITELQNKLDDALSSVKKVTETIGNTKVPEIKVPPIVIPKPNTDNFEKALDNLEKIIVKRINSIAAEGQKLKTLGGQLSTGLTLPIVGLATAALSMNKDVKSAFEGLQTNIKSSTQKVGDILEKNLNISSLIDKLSKGITELVDKFESLSPTMQKVIIVVAGVVAAIGPLLAVIGSLMAALPAIATGLGALSVAFGVMTGPIGLVVIALGSLVSAYFALKDNTKTAKDYQNEFATAMSRATSESTKQVSALDALYKKTQDTTLSLQERKKAVDELQRLYPKYFGSIKDEIILNGGAETSYNRLRVAIVNASKARAAGALLDKRSNDLLLSQEQRKLEIAKQLQKVYALQSAQKAGEKTYKVKFDEISTGFSGTVNTSEQLKVQKEKARLLIQAYADEYKDYLTANKSLIDIQKAGAQDLADTTVKGADIIVAAEKQKADKIIKAKKETKDKILKEEQGFTADQLMDNWALELINAKAKAIQNGIATDIQGIADAKLKMQEQLDQYNEMLNNKATELLESGIADVAFSIGEALANGGNFLAAAAGSVLNTLSQFMVMFGKDLIKMGGLSVVYAKLLIAIKAAKFNPLLLLAAGAAAIAIGGALSAASSNISNGVGGGSSGGGSISTGGGGSSNYSSSFSSGGGGQQEFVFRISGNDLLAVTERARDKNTRIGG